jgi:hypothetical protein
MLWEGSPRNLLSTLLTTTANFLKSVSRGNRTVESVDVTQMYLSVSGDGRVVTFVSTILKENR